MCIEFKTIKIYIIMKTTDRNETVFNKVVNLSEDGEVTVLDAVFNYNDGFKGAVGTKFYPISKSIYKERTKKSEVKEHIRDCFEADYILDNYGSVEKLYKEMKDNNEIETFCFDTSYSELWDYLREELKLSEKQAFIFDCVGGGRCFDKDFQGNVNPELSEIIREYEK